MKTQEYRVLLSDYRAPDISGELPFLYKRAGAKVEVYSEKKSWLLKNSYYDVWHEADVSSREAYIEGLLKITQNNHYDWIVLTEDEALQAVVDLVTDDELASKLLPITNSADRAFVGSKAAFSRIAHERGLMTPRYEIYKEGAMSTTLTYPILLKLDRSSGGMGVFICADERSLKETLSKLSIEKKKNAVLQEYIDGETIAVEALFHKGRLVTYACSRVFENMGSVFAVSSARLYYVDEAVLASAREAGLAFGIHGFCNMTFLKDTITGKIYIIEADTRPNIWFALARHIGIDFSKALRQFFTGELTACNEQTSEHVLRHFYREINRSLSTGDFFNVLKWVVNRENRWKCIPWYDSKLFIATIQLLIQTRMAAFGDAHPLLRSWKQKYLRG